MLSTSIKLGEHREGFLLREPAQAPGVTLILLKIGQGQVVIPFSSERKVVFAQMQEGRLWESQNKRRFEAVLYLLLWWQRIVHFVSN